MTNPGGVIPDGALVVSNLSELQNLNNDKIRKQLRKPAEDALEEMIDALRSGLLERFADVFRGLVPPGFEVVADGFGHAVDSLRDIAEGAAEAARKIILEIVRAIDPSITDLPTPEEALRELGKWAAGIRNEFDAWAKNWADAVQAIAEDAVQKIIDGLAGIGSFAERITEAVLGFVRQTIQAIFGDGGTKWAQEMLVASGPVVEGVNDLPLGFILPYAATIDSVIARTSENVVDSSQPDSKVVFEFRVNGVAKRIVTFPGGQSQVEVNGLNIAVAKGQVVTIHVTEATSMMANLSVAVWGRYR